MYMQGALTKWIEVGVVGEDGGLSQSRKITRLIVDPSLSKGASRKKELGSGTSPSWLDRLRAVTYREKKRLSSELEL